MHTKHRGVRNSPIFSVTLPRIFQLHSIVVFTFCQRRRYWTEASASSAKSCLKKWAFRFANHANWRAQKSFSSVSTTVSNVEQFSKTFFGSRRRSEEQANHVEVLTIFESLMIMYLIVAFYHSPSSQLYTLGRRSNNDSQPTKLTSSLWMLCNLNDHISYPSHDFFAVRHFIIPSMQRSD